MEANKENHIIYKTKIPLPVDPLPPIPRHLTIGYIKKIEAERAETAQARHPLRTLNSQAGPSHQCVREHPTPLKLDTRHVTLRNKGEERLDWNYGVFRDDQQIKQRLTIRDDDDESKTRQYHHKSKKYSSLHDVNIPCEPLVKPVTPSKSAYLEPNVIKNIKKSLKRPHSRELVGLAVKEKEKNDDNGIITRRLSRGRLCERLKSPDRLMTQYTSCLKKDYTKDLFEYLLSVEKKPVTKLLISSLTRSCVVNWLMKVNGVDGDPAVLQSACWYLDSILSREEVHMEKLQLVASACYWIAQKLHQTPAPALRLVKLSSYYFTSKQLLAAERVVLKTLGFPQQPVVPYEYIGYLAWCCDESQPGEIEVSATFLVMCGVLVNKPWSAECPSVVAAAAVRNTLLLLGKKDMVWRLVACPVYQAALKKADNFQGTCTAQRVAARIVGSSKYDYRAPFDQYGMPPLYLAQKIVKAATKFAILDAVNTVK